MLTDATGSLVVSPLVVAELDHLLRARLSAEAARVFAEDLATGAYELAALWAADVGTAPEVDRQYASLGLGLTDAHLLVLAATYRTDMVLSLDERHLRAVPSPPRTGRVAVAARRRLNVAVPPGSADKLDCLWTMTPGRGLPPT